MPVPGGFNVPQQSRAVWKRYPPYTLGCRYRDIEDIVTVVLPYGIRTCKFAPDPQVECR